MCSSVQQVCKLRGKRQRVTQNTHATVSISTLANQHILELNDDRMVKFPCLYKQHLQFFGLKLLKNFFIILPFLMIHLEPTYVQSVLRFCTTNKHSDQEQVMRITVRHVDFYGQRDAESRGRLLTKRKWVFLRRIYCLQTIYR